MENNGYIFSGVMGRGLTPEFQGFLTSEEEVERWTTGINGSSNNNNIMDSLRSFLDEVDFGNGELAFLYAHTHSGSGMDKPAAKANLKEEGVLDIRWYDKNNSCMRTRDLCIRNLVVAVRLNPDIVQSIHIHGLQVTTHTFAVGGVRNEADAFATLRGLDDLKNKSDEELKVLTFLSINNADHERILQALPYLPELVNLSTTGIHWKPKTLELLSKVTSLKKLRVGGRYWAEPNNFKYEYLEALTPLALNLESLDISHTSIDGNRGDRIFFRGDENDDNEGDGTNHAKPTRDQILSREFARGMKTILKFTNLRELTIGAKMYPKGTKFLTRHPSLTAIHGVKNLSYEVTYILANSRLSKQITSLDCDYIQHNQMPGPIIAQIAKFTNLTHLGMHHIEELDDNAMMELAPLVNLKQLYVPFSRISSDGLKVIRLLPKISVLSLGYCRGITDGLENIQHLNLTHLDVRSIKDLKTEHLLPIIKSSPNLIDLNLRYAEGIDAKALAKEAADDLKGLKFFNDLSVPKASKALKGIAAKRYYEDQPFHTLPSFS